MPNIIVPATGEALPKARYNLSEIMKAAWRRYRSIRARYADWQIAEGIVDASFATALRIA